MCVEAQSAAVWKKWLAEPGADERMRLSVYRGGAIRSPTRRHWRLGADPEASKCPFCNCPGASARHLVTACPRFGRLRQRLEAALGLDPAWWAQLPRVTSKAGWITTAAAAMANRRAELQTAVCELGLAVTLAAPPPGTVVLEPVPAELPMWRAPLAALLR